MRFNRTNDPKSPVHALEARRSYAILDEPCYLARPENKPIPQVTLDEIYNIDAKCGESAVKPSFY